MENTRINFGEYFAEPDTTVSQEGLWNVFDQEENVVMVHVTAGSLETGYTEDGIEFPSAVRFLPNVQESVNNQLLEMGVISDGDDAFRTSNFILDEDGNIHFDVTVPNEYNSPSEEVVMPTVSDNHFIRINMDLGELVSEHLSRIAQAFSDVIHELEEEYREAEEYEMTVRGMMAL